MPQLDVPTVARAAGSAVAGLVAGGLAGGLGRVSYAPAFGWTVAGLVYVVWTWLVIAGMGAERTRTHATREDPTRASTDVIVVVASVASLAGVVYLLQASTTHGFGADLAAAVGVASVISSWLVVHTVFMLRYASLYYDGNHPNGIDFNQDDPPQYLDFAYLAFTIGMTYQVSDTSLRTGVLRRTALRHALLSFLLGAVVIATTVNLVAGLRG